MPGCYRKEIVEKDDTDGKLFVGGIGWESDEESVKEYFEKFGPVAYVKLKRNREDPSKHRGFAFVKFVNSTDADAVLCHREPHFVDGAKIDPKSACPLGVKPEDRTKKVFVGGLQAETTEERLMEYFAQFGDITGKIEFAIDRNTKKKRGFCFIEFANEGIVDRIVRTKFHEVAGKRVETKRALSKQQQQQQLQQQLQQQQQQQLAVAGGQSALGQPFGGPIIQHTGHVTPYGQPVIYIHPQSVSHYPYMGMAGAGGQGGGYSASLENLYMPYGQAQQGQSNRYAFSNNNNNNNNNNISNNNNANTRRFQSPTPRYSAKPP